VLPLPLPLNAVTCTIDTQLFLSLSLTASQRIIISREPFSFISRQSLALHKQALLMQISLVDDAVAVEAHTWLSMAFVMGLL
jgi:hypothetical protein